MADETMAQYLDREIEGYKALLAERFEQIAALTAELEHVKKERDAWKEQRDAEQEAWTFANARAERAIEGLRMAEITLAVAAEQDDVFAAVERLNELQDKLSDLLRDLDAEEGR